MRAEVVSVGTELLLGQLVDTNAPYLAGKLPELGLDLYFISQAGDNQARLAETLRRAWDRSDVVLTTGGLGPTEDDVTREAIAQMLGEEMKVDGELAATLRSFFSRRGGTMPERNLKQATLVPSAQAIPNPRGTAPGWWVEREGKVLAAMPGPPHEMQFMWEEQVAPRLARRFHDAIIVSRTIKTWGIGEGTVDEMLTPLLHSQNPTIGVYAKSDGIHLRLTAKAKGREEAWELLRPLESQVRSILGASVWGMDEDTLEKLAGKLLQERGYTLAVMESCTGGLLASTLTDVPGSSAYFKGGVIAYSNALKVAHGVPAELLDRQGAISDEAAVAMAEGVRHSLGAQVGLATTGVAGPEPLEGKPVGQVHLAVVTPQGQQVSRTLYPGPRELVKRRSATAALILLRRALLA
ncbi:MAG: competence/damage-inducible protein A [Dehalococcoidia bacterium]|nr:competence/damage-inducible protein A [Dehalococcoidia bacterium]